MGEKSGKELARSIRLLGRRDSRLAKQMLTGHGVLNYHMHKLGRSDRPGCRACGKQQETSFHVLALCPVYARLRLLLLGSAFLESELLRRLPVRI